MQTSARSRSGRRQCRRRRPSDENGAGEGNAIYSLAEHHPPYNQRLWCSISCDTLPLTPPPLLTPMNVVLPRRQYAYCCRLGDFLLYVLYIVLNFSARKNTDEKLLGCMSISSNPVSKENYDHFHIACFRQNSKRILHSAPSATKIQKWS